MSADPLQDLDDFSRSFAEPLFEEFPALREHAQVENGVLLIDFHPGIYREDVRAFVSTDYDEITVGLGKWHTHFDWPMYPTPATSEGFHPHYADPIAALRGILADELLVEVRHVDGKWTRSTLLDPGEEPDVAALKHGEEVTVLSWSGRGDRVLRSTAEE